VCLVYMCARRRMCVCVCLQVKSTGFRGPNRCDQCDICVLSLSTSKKYIFLAKVGSQSKNIRRFTTLRNGESIHVFNVWISVHRYL